MRIDVWSDVVCPWCYIGKVRLDEVVKQFTATHPDSEIEVVWRSYELDPAAPTVPVETVAEALGRKYGGGVDGGRTMIDRVEAVAAEEGMLWRHHASLRVNTISAHRLLHWALEEHGSQAQSRLKQALFAAYFEQERNVADIDTLVELAASVNLDGGRARAVLESDEFANDVEADVRQAAGLGATGVPFYVVDQKYGISGAQPREFFTQVIERAWNESKPQISLMNAGGDACGPDGCAL